jgi:hypothetical protein
MPTPAQVINRASPPPGRGRHYTATVTAVGPPVVVSLEPGGSSTQALALNGAVYVVGNRVLVLVTDGGNYVLGRLG